MSLTSPASSTSATYAVPPRSYTDPERVDGGERDRLPQRRHRRERHHRHDHGNGTLLNLVDLNLATDLQLDGVLSDPTSTNVVSGINGFIANVNAQLTPLSQLLGLQVAGADLYGVPRPSCRTPSLRG